MMAASRTVMLRVLLKVLLIFCVKNATQSTNSVCYSFNGYYVVDLPSRLIYESLRILQENKSLNLLPKITVQLLLLLNGDIELCPGQQNETFDTDIQNITKCRGMINTQKY